MYNFNIGDTVTYNNGRSSGVITSFAKLFWTGEIVAYVKGPLLTVQIRVNDGDLKPA